MRAPGRRRWAGLALLSILVGGSAAVPILADGATQAPPAIHVNPTSGPPGELFELTGEHLIGGTTYQVLICPKGDLAGTPCGYSGANLVGLSQLTTLQDGSVPAGTTARIPDLLAGPFAIEVIASSGVVASTPFDVLAPTLAATPDQGPSGWAVAFTGSGFGAGASFTICFVAVTEPNCGGSGIYLGEFTADASGGVPNATSVTIPGALPGEFKLGAFLKDNNAIVIAADAFRVVAPTLQLIASEGPAGMAIPADGAGYAAGAKYVICLVPAGAAQCGGVGTYIGTFTADGTGAIPDGTIARIPPTATAGGVSIGVLLADSTPVLLTSVPFAITAGTAPPATSAAATPGATTAAAAATPSPSGNGSPAASGDGGGMLWLLLLLLVVVVGGFLYWRRRSERKPPV
jgi:hypothetical protein